MSYQIYTGCYTMKFSGDLDGKGKGIMRIVYHEDSNTAEEILVARLRNPSYLALHPDLSILYAVEELPQTDNPLIYGYRIKPGGDLEILNSQPLEGDCACHVAVIQGHLMVANYGSGNVNVFPLDEEGLIMGLSSNICHEGSGKNEERQEAPHAHMTYGYRDLVFVNDLGIDCCKAYLLTGGKLVPNPAMDLKTEPGTGPRHMVSHPHLPLVYVVTELTSQVFTFRLSDEGVELLNETYVKANGGHGSAAAIRLLEDRFLYVSERSDDSLVQFRLDESGIPIRLGSVDVNKAPRDFNIDPSGQCMVIGGQDDHAVSFYEVSEDSGELSMKYNHGNVNSVSCIIYYPSTPF